LGIEEPFDLIYWHKMRGAIAQYQIGHLQKVATLDLLCGQELKNATLVGSYLKGVSVNDCIKEAKEKALRFF
jgi:protoporphyrinogen oxidase